MSEAVDLTPFESDKDMQFLNGFRNKVGLRGYNPGIWAAMGIVAVRSTGYSISFTYLPLYLYQERHISMTLVGTIILVSGIRIHAL